MSTAAIIIFLVIGLIAGWLAAVIVGAGGGPVVYLISGVLGAYVGPFVLDLLKLKVNLGHPLVTQIVVSAIGAVFVIGIGQLIF